MKHKSIEPMIHNPAKVGEHIPNQNFITAEEAGNTATQLKAAEIALDAAVYVIPADDTVSNEHLRRALAAVQTARDKYEKLYVKASSDLAAST